MAEEKTPETPPVDPNEGPGKGKAFFDRAKSVAATGNFDYAIEMYIDGLNREPFNLEEHKALREVAMRRKLAGGKAGGGLLGIGGAKSKFKGKTPKEGLLNNEFTLAKDVGNIPAMLAMFRNADLMGLKDLVIWIGATLLKDANKTNKTPKVEIYTEMGEVYAKYEEFERACDVINEASKLKPYDNVLPSLAQQYAAQATLKKGNYEQGESFRKSIKDVDATNKLLQDDNLAKSEEYRLELVNTAKLEYEKNPMELQVIAKYTRALVDMDDEASENKAMEILKKSYESTKIYRLKAAIGDVRIKQFKRNERMLAEAVKMDPNDADMAHQLQDLRKERLAYELGEFKDRAEHMPTDLIIKFELGMRHYYSKHFEDAIPALQEAQTNPKVRVEALLYLGRSFLEQNMKPEAVDTLSRAIESYDLRETGDAKTKGLHYWYARALEANNQTPDAIKVYSKVIQWDVNYLDAKKRLNDLRAKLEGGEAPK